MSKWVTNPNMVNVEKNYGKNVHLYGFYWGDLNTTDNRGTFKGSIKKHKLLRVLYNNCLSREINHHIYPTLISYD